MDKITDFGEKIGGARKDKAQELAECFFLVTNEALIAQPLSKVFKSPDFRGLYVSGDITEDQARMCRYLFGKIKSKPRTLVTGWARKTHLLLQELVNILTNERSSLDGLFNNKDEEKRQMLFVEEMKAANWPAQEYNRNRYYIGYSTYNCKYTVQTDTLVKSKHSTIIEAVQCIRQLTSAIANKRSITQFEARLFLKNNEYFISPKGKSSICIRRGIFSLDELRRILKEETDTLQAEYNRLRDLPESRRDWNRPRVGNSYRNGEDITTDAFRTLLPFRGCEFGNWVSQDERTSNLNECADALCDMAAVIGINHAQISHNSTLALAFGSRGTGKAQAHYECVKRVINLTKISGAGCLAHEWWHSLDNYIMICQNQPLLFSITDYACLDNERIKEAALSIYRKINFSPFSERSRLSDEYKSKKYYGTMVEMTARAFEAYIYFKLESRGICNDYLVNYVPYNQYSRKDCYPYPTREENSELTPLFDAFFAAVYQ